MTEADLDGNSAALRVYEAEQVRNERLHDAYADKAMDAIVDDLFSNRKVGKFSLQDFCDFVTEEHIAMFIIANVDIRAQLVSKLEKEVEASIRRYFDDSDILSERIRSMDEDARAEQ